MNDVLMVLIMFEIHITTYNRIDGMIVSVLATTAKHCGFEPMPSLKKIVFVASVHIIIILSKITYSSYDIVDKSAHLVELSNNHSLSDSKFI